MKTNQILAISLIGFLLSACHNHKVDSVQLPTVPKSTCQYHSGDVDKCQLGKTTETLSLPAIAAISSAPVVSKTQNQNYVAAMNSLGFETRETDRGVVVYLPPTAHFELNSAQIRTATDNRLQQFVTETNKAYVSHRNVIVAGHTDELGPDTANQELSNRRANSVEQRLISLGFNSSRLSSRGFGESYPRFNGSLNQHLNRRVEFLVLK